MVDELDPLKSLESMELEFPGLKIVEHSRKIGVSNVLAVEADLTIDGINSPRIEQLSGAFENEKIVALGIGPLSIWR